MSGPDDQRERGEWHPPADNVTELPTRRTLLDEFPFLRDIITRAASGDVFPDQPFDEEETT